MNFAWEQSLVAKAEAEEKQRQLEQFIADAEQAKEELVEQLQAQACFSREGCWCRGLENSGRVPEVPPVGAGRVRRHHQQEHDARRP